MSDSTRGESVQSLDPRQSRMLLIGIAMVVVVVSMIVGLFIGHNAQVVTDRFSILAGVVTVPITPGYVAAYGGVVAAGILALVYLLVRAVSAWDSQAKR